MTRIKELGGKGGGKTNFNGGSFYTTSVPSAANSRLSPLPQEPADFYGRNDSVDIPLDSAADLKKKERDLQAREADLRKREEMVKRKEEAAARAGIVLEEKNWPPFFPIIHHDIANEIPIHLQKLQYVAFTTYLEVSHQPLISWAIKPWLGSFTSLGSGYFVLRRCSAFGLFSKCTCISEAAVELQR